MKWRLKEVSTVFVFSAIVLLICCQPTFSSIEKSNTCFICHESTQVVGEQKIINKAKYFSSKHQSLSCNECHVTHGENPHEETFVKLDSGTRNLADALKIKDSKDNYALASCAKCHLDIFKSYREGVHGKSLFDQMDEYAAYCTDCHGDLHALTGKESRSSMINIRNIPVTCGKCHGNSEIIAKTNLSSLVIPAYKESFHGKKYMLGSSRVAVCSSCHGSHNIISPTRENAEFEKYLTESCGKCHKGATVKFIETFKHVEIDKKSQTIVHYAELGFIALTLSTMLALSTHIVLEIMANLRVAIKKRRGKNERGE